MLTVGLDENIASEYTRGQKKWMSRETNCGLGCSGILGAYLGSLRSSSNRPPVMLEFIKPFS